MELRRNRRDLILTNEEFTDEQYSGMTLMDKVDPLPEPASSTEHRTVAPLRRCERNRRPPDYLRDYFLYKGSLCKKN